MSKNLTGVLNDNNGCSLLFDDGSTCLLGRLVRGQTKFKSSTQHPKGYIELASIEYPDLECQISLDLLERFAVFQAGILHGRIFQFSRNQKAMVNDPASYASAYSQMIAEAFTAGKPSCEEILESIENALIRGIEIGQKGLTLDQFITNIQGENE